MFRTVVLTLATLSLSAGTGTAADESSKKSGQSLRLVGAQEGKGGGSIEVVGLASADLDHLRKAELSTENWQELFAVYVLGDTGAIAKDQPAMLGSYRVEETCVRFTPRFALRAGLRYQAVFRPARLPGRKSGDDVSREFALPRAKPAELTTLRNIYPTRNQLPENQLKFYLHFSAPMSRGEAYANLRLLDDKGKAVESPFLELDEELWDPEGKRFTLLFDPGRIKRGLKPREDLGPALVEGKNYTLVIEQNWKDAAGYPLKQTVRKAFRVLAPRDASPNPKDWKIEAPTTGTTTALTVTFPEPLDHALLQRMLWVTDARGQQITGQVEVSEEETRWRFTPDAAWQAGAYDLVIDTTLEDLAGNSIARPFEVDTFRPIERDSKPTTVKRAFVVAAPR
jgi:hypothetical protein